MSLVESFRLMARYNQWMNERVYDAAAALDDATLRRDQGAFFGSVLGTLNHLLVADTIWLKRFAGHPRGFEALAYPREVPSPPALDAILHEDLPSLRQARQAMDRTILEWAGELTEADLETDLEYSNSKGRTFSDPFAGLVQHFFNHQTHHRGQVTALLTQNGVEVGVTDLVALIRA
ncbi:MAG TPA: DinB family protein [Gammaproteobacteria bacterium]|nr:DinB family protein [Gammaproteobacteria bacterium]